jgi:hypothetical protein
MFQVFKCFKLVDSFSKLNPNFSERVIQIKITQIIFLIQYKFSVIKFQINQRKTLFFNQLNNQKLTLYNSQSIIYPIKYTYLMILF